MTEEELEDLLGIGCCDYHIEIGKKAKKEIERLNKELALERQIKKEAREYIEKEYVQVENKEYNLGWNNLEYIIKKILEILDKENK